MNLQDIRKYYEYPVIDCCNLQGVEFRAPLVTSAPLQRVIERLRTDIPPLAEDRYLAPELERAKDLVASGAILEALGVPLPEVTA